jgi:prolyl oligopeptidase
MVKIVLWMMFVAILAGCAASPPPGSRRIAVTDTYHGVEVVDHYRWLEDWDAPRVRQWSDDQNAYARRILDALPAADDIRRRIGEILRAESVSYVSLDWRAGTLLAVKNQPPKEQPLLVVLDSENEPDNARIVVDPNEIDPSGGTTIDWFVPSPDGRRVAVSLSEGGSEVGDLHVFEVATGQSLGEVIPRVNAGTAGGDVAWAPDGSGFYYTRYPRADERAPEELSFYQQIWFHRLGSSPDDDRFELGDEFPRIAECRLQAESSSDVVLATVQDGDSGRFEHFLRSSNGTWARIARYEDRVVQARLGPGGSLFLISRLDAPRGKVLRLDAGRLALDEAATIVEQGPDTIVSDFWGSPSMIVTRESLYLTYQLGGPSTIRAFDHSGRPRRGPEVAPVSNVGRIVVAEGDAILVHNQSYTRPPGWLRFDPASGLTNETALVTTSPVDLSNVEVLRELAVSSDGTEVPVNIVRRVGTPDDGSSPTLLTGYGGYGINFEPRFTPVIQLWLERGGVFAVANIRGGGEFGEGWHRDGMLTRKQNVFDDFAAAMQHLIDRGTTSPERLAIRGASNGGLLMGAMITQHPELCRAVVASVGIYDMLRVELSPNGAFNIPEFGTVSDPEQFRALHAYSPYHAVADRTAYPAVLFMTGENDPRVDPMQSRKMTARLQAANSSGSPIVLRTSGNTGHGGATPLSAKIEELTDIYAFLVHELGASAEH